MCPYNFFRIHYFVFEHITSSYVFFFFCSTPAVLNTGAVSFTNPRFVSVRHNIVHYTRTRYNKIHNTYNATRFVSFFLTLPSPLESSWIFLLPKTRIICAACGTMVAKNRRETERDREIASSKSVSFFWYLIHRLAVLERTMPGRIKP